jgi:hypothetical protein
MSTALRDPTILAARYHDLDHDKRGPEPLAEALDLALDEVFPIHDDIGKEVSRAAVDAIRGTVHAVPLERLSRAELIKLAVSGA